MPSNDIHIQPSDARQHVVLAVEEINGIHGGVERTVIKLANFLVGKGVKVTILTFDQENSGHPVYDLDENVRRYDIGLIQSARHEEKRNEREKYKKKLPDFIISIVRNVMALKRIINVSGREIPAIIDALKDIEPDVIVSFKTHFHRYMIPAAMQMSIPVIASEHNPPKVLYHHYVCLVDRYVILSYLKKADAVRVLLKSFIADYPPKVQGKCRAIANGISLPDCAVRTGCKAKKIINIGRLYFQKDQETLIRSFALLANKYPDWCVEIYGDGEMKGHLISVIKSLKMEKRVLLKGQVSDVISVYLTADIFALPSLFEGFGNVTLEAMATGLPIVAFDNNDGNNELVEHGVNGLLVSNKERIENFSKALDVLMGDRDLRDEMSAQSYEKAKAFENTHIMQQWYDLLTEKVTKN